MNLEQFKKEFANDAYARSEQQEKTIKELHSRIKQLTEDLEFRKYQAQQLENRCYCHTLGSMCGHCGFRSVCQARATREKETEK